MPTVKTDFNAIVSVVMIQTHSETDDETDQDTDQDTNQDTDQDVVHIAAFETDPESDQAIYMLTI